MIDDDDYDDDDHTDDTYDYDNDDTYDTHDYVDDTNQKVDLTIPMKHFVMRRCPGCKQSRINNSMSAII